MLTSEQVWVWWDDVTLSDNQEMLEVVLAGIKDTLIVQQRKTQKHLVLENQDCKVINKLVMYIINMSYTPIFN
jgi:hypothetical protein